MCGRSPGLGLDQPSAVQRIVLTLKSQMKAISNFKALLPSRSRLNSPRLNLSPSDAASPTQPHHHIPRFSRHKPKPSMDEQELADMKRINEEHAARLLEERKRVLQSRGNDPTGGPYHSAPAPETTTTTTTLDQDEPEPTPFSSDGVGSGGRNHGEPPGSQTAPPVLGVGTGGHDDFPSRRTTKTSSSSSSSANEPPPSVVADSPTAVDFNVYDRAYEEEIERIKKSGGRPSVYMTWHLGEKAKVREEEAVDVLEDRPSGDEGAEEGPSGNGNSSREKGKGLFKPTRFADLVAQTIKDTKDKVQSAEGGERKQGREAE